MKIIWLTVAWEDYLYWQLHDKKTLVKNNSLLKDVQRNPFDGIGNPEALKHSLSGWWSRRINLTDRLVYNVEEGSVIVLQCRKHY